jgi:hypothetical protein
MGSPLFDPEERSVLRSKMIPRPALCVASAEHSRGVEASRKTRAPQETGRTPGSPFFGYFLWRSKESNWPRAAMERAGSKHHPKRSTTKGPARPQSALVTNANLQTPPPTATAFMLRQAHHEREVAPPRIAVTLYVPPQFWRCRSSAFASLPRKRVLLRRGLCWSRHRSVLWG